jgi:hypothetical protein
MTQNTDPRQASSNRRQAERRRHERRVVQYAYGSPEWIAYIQQHYLLWPKQDRRRSDRRQQDRRNTHHERRIRTNQKRSYLLPHKNIQDILSDDEKKMLRQVMRSDEN